jgi:hypothetical protein
MPSPDGVRLGFQRIDDVEHDGREALPLELAEGLWSPHPPVSQLQSGPHVRNWPEADDLRVAAKSSDLGYTGRSANVAATAESDPKATSVRVFGPLPEGDLRDTA